MYNKTDCKSGEYISKLWFDVERRYKTMEFVKFLNLITLWFDVERRYKTMFTGTTSSLTVLWFDVERRYKTIT